MLSLTPKRPRPSPSLASREQALAAIPPTAGQAAAAHTNLGLLSSTFRATERAQYGQEGILTEGLSRYYQGAGWLSPDLPVESPTREPDELNKLYPPPKGEEPFFSEAIPDSLARVIHRQRLNEIASERTIARYNNARGFIPGLGVGFVGFLNDPLQAATSFVPGAGQVKFAQLLGKLGIGARTARVGGEVGAGAVAGGAAEAVLALAQQGISSHDVDALTTREVIERIFYGAAGNALFQGVAPAVGEGIDAFRARGRPGAAPERVEPARPEAVARPAEAVPTPEAVSRPVTPSPETPVATPLREGVDFGAIGTKIDPARVGEIKPDGIVGFSSLQGMVRLRDGTEIPVVKSAGTLWGPNNVEYDWNLVTAFKQHVDGAQWVPTKAPAAEVPAGGAALAEPAAGVTARQPAYHGSPTKFDQFSADFHGTGEGMSVGGWGLHLSDDIYDADTYTVRNNFRRDMEDPGYLYTTEVPGDQELLLADAPLSAQGRGVKKKLLQLGEEVPLFANMLEADTTGRSIYLGLVQAISDVRKAVENPSAASRVEVTPEVRAFVEQWAKYPRDDEVASRLLAAAGIPGQKMRYPQAEGNEFIIYDPSAITLKRREGGVEQEVFEPASLPRQSAAQTQRATVQAVASILADEPVSVVGPRPTTPQSTLDAIEELNAARLERPDPNSEAVAGIAKAAQAEAAARPAPERSEARSETRVIHPRLTPLPLTQLDDVAVMAVFAKARNNGELHLERVPVENLRAVQAQLFEENPARQIGLLEGDYKIIEDLEAQGKTASGIRLPDGTVHLTDGHHRAARALLEGKKDIPVLLADVTNVPLREGALPLDVRSTIQKQLTEIGVDPAQAEASATIFDAFFRTMAARTGKTAQELYDESGLTFEKVTTAEGDFFQPAWHSSPHVFEQFSTDFMGAGEGNQAFGWGLYMSQKKGLYDHLRKTTGEYEVPGLNVANLSPEGVVGLRNFLSQFEQDFTTSKIGFTVSKAAVLERLDHARSYWGQQQQAAKSPSPRAIAEIRIAQTDELIQAFSTMPDEIEVRQPLRGRTYEVDVPDDNNLLLWDRPLTEQPEHVREAIEKLWAVIPGFDRGRLIGDDELTGKLVYEGAVQDLEALKSAGELGDEVLRLWEEDFGNAPKIKITGTGLSTRTRGLIEETALSNLEYGDGRALSVAEILATFKAIGENTAGKTDPYSVAYAKAYRETAAEIEAAGDVIININPKSKPFRPDEFVSRFLLREGIEGHKYLDQGSRVTPTRASVVGGNFTPQGRKLVASTAAFRHQGGEDISNAAIAAYFRETAASMRVAVADMLRVEGDNAETRPVADNELRGAQIYDDAAQELETTPGITISMTVSPEATYNFVIFSGDKVKIRSFYQDSRGAIKFGEGKALISLFENSDPSTIIHEAGHFILETFIRLAKTEPKLAPDLAILQRQFDFTDVPSVKSHEDFASSWETYLRTGKAPSEELKSVFKLFKEWITEVYQRIKGKLPAINPEIRKLFDRMLAEPRQFGTPFAKSGARPSIEGQVDPTAAEWTLFRGGSDLGRIFDARTEGAEAGALFFSPAKQEAELYTGGKYENVVESRVTPGRTRVFDISALLDDPNFVARVRAESVTGKPGREWEAAAFDEQIARLRESKRYHESFNDELRAIGTEPGPWPSPAAWGAIHTAIKMAKEEGLDTIILRNLAESGGKDQIAVLNPAMILDRPAKPLARLSDYTFRTSKGTEYEVRGSRTFRPDPRGDQLSDQTIYISPEDAKILRPLKLAKGTVSKLEQRPDGKWGLKWIQGEKAGTWDEAIALSAKDEPAEGLVPVGLTKDGTYANIGTQIVEINKPLKADPEMEALQKAVEELGLPPEELQAIMRDLEDYGTAQRAIPAAMTQAQQCLIEGGMF